MQSIIKKRILMLLPVRTQPRYRKRIKGFKDVGASVKSCYFDRDYFGGEELGCSSHCIGKMKEGSYLSRIVVLLKASITLRQYKDEVIIYCFGMDMLFLCFLSGFSKKKVFYEVSDIRPIVVASNFKGRMTRTFEKLLLKIVDVIVVTAPGFVEGYYKDILKISDEQRFFVLENKLDIAVFSNESVAPVKNESKINIGYFGLLRCSKSWDALKELVEAFPEKFEIHVYGRPINPVSLPDEASKLDGISYYGPFIWPTDLNRMYSSIDVVWGCYPYGDSTPGNWQWAQTNRFYEACFFKKPLITLLDSADARAVINLGIGFSVDLSNTTKAVDFLQSKLNKDYLSSLTSNINSVPKNVYLYMDDHERLINLIETAQS